MEKLDEKFWERYFKVYDTLNALIPYQKLLKELEKQLDLSSEDIVLDLGSGTGNLMERLKNKCKKVIGIDYSKEGVQISKSKDKDFEIILQDIRQPLPFPDNYFSKVVSNNVIYTFSKKDQENIVSEVMRVLKPRGKFVISNVKKGFSPVKIYLDHIFKNPASFLKLIWPAIRLFCYNLKIKKSGLAKNYNFFGPEDQKKMLESAGFKNVSEDLYLYSGQAIMNTCYKQ